MSFHPARSIDQVIALLRQRGRITYRVLKREFSLDDEQVADLKEELIEGQELAVDKDGKVLIWVGDGALPSESSPSPRSPPTASAPAPQSGVPEAERRQLTLMPLISWVQTGHPIAGVDENRLHLFGALYK